MECCWFFNDMQRRIDVKSFKNSSSAIFCPNFKPLTFNLPDRETILDSFDVQFTEDF